MRHIAVVSNCLRGATQMHVTTIGLDLAKNVFQIHGIYEDGEVAFNRALRRAQVLTFFESLEPCLVGIEACGTSHHWAREISKLGHNVKLIPPVYVKPYVKRGKSDAVDAAAICEAVTRPTMRFVEVKTPEQQAILAVHRTRDLIIRQRTQTINMLRAQLAEFGIVLPKGIYHALQFAKDCLNGEQPDLPEVAGDVIFELCDQLRFLHSKILRCTRQMNKIAKHEKRVALLRTIPGVGPITASAIVATVGSGKQFNNGREFAAWLGLTPLNKSSGGKERLGHISKMGDQYIRRLLVLGMTSRIRSIRTEPEKFDPWFADILERKPSRVAAVAMANKTARIMWAVLTRNEPYQVRTI
jgi:transposase